MLTETYMRLHSDWYRYIQSFIALEVPFSGSSGYVALAPILGYDLQLPLPYSTCKGIELACASQQYMMTNPANSMATFT